MRVPRFIARLFAGEVGVVMMTDARGASNAKARCSVCVDIHSRELEQAGESSERMHTVAAWRETPYFSDAERAALALAEAATRLADSRDSVSWPRPCLSHTTGP